MFECFKNDIYALFLPAYTSHVLQPLDISIFSPLKARYRRELKDLNLYAIPIDTPLAKAQFLQVYERARRAALTTSNIKSGWRGTGLWPVNRTKPLKNDMTKSSEPLAPRTPPSRGPDASAVTTRISFWTPISSQDARRQINIIPVSARSDPLVRQLFSKMSKGLDSKNVMLATQEASIGQLEAQVSQLRPKKRQKVNPDPNSRFVRINEIRCARIRMEEALNPEAASREAQNVHWKDWCSEFRL